MPKSTNFTGLLDSLASAIAQQSKESALNGYRSRSLLTYCISPYAVICMFTAVLLNRIIIFASSRRMKKLPFVSNVVLRLLAIYLLVEGSYGVLVSLKLYSNSKLVTTLFQSSIFNFDPDTFKNRKFLMWYYSRDYFHRSGVASGVKYTLEGPSTSVLLPYYLSICFNQIIETFILVTSGANPYVKTSLTLFEYSVAFQEVQGVNLRPSVQILGATVLSLVEMLSVHVMGILNLLKYRLIPSTVLGICEIAYFVNLTYTGDIFYMPFFYMLGFLPYVICFFIILISLAVYFLAGLFKGSFQNLTVTAVFHNLNSINISLSEDFYTALMTLCSFVVNASTSQSYLVEAPAVSLPESTYLEHRVRHSVGYGKLVKVAPEMYPVTPLDHRKQWQTSARFRRTGSSLRSFGRMLSIALHNIKPQKETDEKVIKQANEVATVDRPTVDLDSLDSDEINDKLLLGDQLSEEDDSPNYILPSEPQADDSCTLKANILGEFIDPVQFQALVAPSSPEQIHDNRIMEFHMSHVSSPSVMLTRSNFNSYYNDDLKLFDLIREKRGDMNLNFGSTIDELRRSAHNRDLNEDTLGTCVICHVNARQIILWPCKCLAICESCRLSLYLRKFTTCVCCRSNVRSYSKVYVP